MKKILIVNQPLNNRGDEAAHKGLVRRIIKSYPTVKITVLLTECNKIDIDVFNVKEPQVNYINDTRSINASRAMRYSFLLGMPFLMRIFKDNQKVWNHINASDLIINAPGGICMGGFRNWYHIMILKIAKYLKKPIAYYGRSIGPFDVKQKYDKLFNKWSFGLLHYFGYLSLRDSISIKIAEDYELQPILTTDSAFLDNPNADIPTDLKKIIDNKMYVVFVPNELIWHYKYQNTDPQLISQFYHQIIDDVLSRDTESIIVMLPQIYNCPIDDRSYFIKLKQTYKGDKSRIYTMEDAYSSDIQQAIISRSKYVIGARYHSIIFAINNNRPFVSLSYEHKMTGLLEIINGTDNMVDISNVFCNQKSVIAAAESVIKVIDKITSIQVDNNMQYKAKNISEEGFKKFQTYLQSLSYQ